MSKPVFKVNPSFNGVRIAASKTINVTGVSTLLMLSLCQTPAIASSLSVGAMHEYMKPEETQILKRIRNDGDATEFVRVTINEVEFVNGKETEKSEVEAKPETRTSLDCQSTSGNATSLLLASPSRLIIPAKGMQATRLVYCGDRKTEHYFRVRFIPALPQQLDEFPIEQKEKEQYKKVISAGVNVLTGFGTVVIIRPENVRFNTVITPAKESSNVRNDGNSVVVLDNLISCEKKDKGKCTDAQKVHIRPGVEKSISAPVNMKTSFDLYEGDTKRHIEI
jgi:hypothetical protein